MENIKIAKEEFNYRVQKCLGKLFLDPSAPVYYSAVHHAQEYKNCKHLVFGFCLNEKQQNNNNNNCHLFVALNAVFCFKPFETHNKILKYLMTMQNFRTESNFRGVQTQVSTLLYVLLYLHTHFMCFALLGYITAIQYWAANKSFGIVQGDQEISALQCKHGKMRQVQFRVTTRGTDSTRVWQGGHTHTHPFTPAPPPFQSSLCPLCITWSFSWSWRPLS